MKIALCFIISYDHILQKEDLWHEWIEHNKDIINVYFYYKDKSKIKSKWILENALPEENIFSTSYYHVVPAYISIMSYALTKDINNMWFCFLTDSCCPIISPKKFRKLFEENYNKSIISYKKCWWNVYFHKRSNLRLLPEKYRLGNDPWFILKKEHVKIIQHFIKYDKNLFLTICSGGLANESIFSIILCKYNLLNDNEVINESSHVCDWNRMTSSTSPYLFKQPNIIDIQFIEKSIKKDFTIFIRKIDKEYSNDLLKKIIYNNM